MTADGRLEALEGPVYPEIGTDNFPEKIEVTRTRIAPGERFLLLSDGVTGRDRSETSLDGIRGASDPCSRFVCPRERPCD